MRLPIVALVLPLAAASAQFEIRTTGIKPRVGLHIGAPAIVSVGVGAALVTEAEPKYAWREYFVMIEPGINAGRVLVGMGSWHKDTTVAGPGFGYMARATLLRRYHGNVDYAGVELSMPVAGWRIGIFRPISGNTRESVRLTTEVFVGW